MTSRPCQAANPNNCRWPEHQKQHNATRAYANARVDYAEVCFSENPAPEDYLRVTTILHEARIKFDATDDGQKQLKDKIKKATDSGDEKTLKTYSDRSIKADAYLSEEAEVNKKVSAAVSDKEKEERRNIYLTGEERRGLGRFYADEIAEERFEGQLKAKVDSKREAAEDATFVTGITMTDEVAAELKDRKARRAARIESFEAGKLQDQASLKKGPKAERVTSSNNVTPEVQQTPNYSVEPELPENVKTERRNIYLTRSERSVLGKSYADGLAEDRYNEQREAMLKNDKEAAEEANSDNGRVLTGQEMGTLAYKKADRRKLIDSFEHGRLESNARISSEALARKAAEEKAKPKSIADKIQSMFRTPKKSTPAPPAGWS